MKKRFWFDPAWSMLLMVVATLIAMSFMDDEHSRNLLAGCVLLACFILFVIAVLLRGLSDRIS